MRRNLLTFIVGFAAGAGACWYYLELSGAPQVSQSAEEDVPDALELAAKSLYESVSPATSRKLPWHELPESLRAGYRQEIAKVHVG